MPDTISPQLIRFPLFQNFLVMHSPLPFPRLDTSKQTDRVQVKATFHNKAGFDYPTRMCSNGSLDFKRSLVSTVRKGRG